MSSKIQDKLLSIEVSPPDGVWEKIAAELEAAQGDRQFASKLYDHAAVPPAGVWDKITASLDLQHPTTTLAEKLALHEVTPPAGTWQKIVTTLDAEHEAAVPERRRLAPFFRYAAAASVIAMLAWGGITLFNKNKKNGDVAVINPAKAEDHTENATHDSMQDTENTESSSGTALQADIAASEEARNDAALEASKKTYARLDVNASSKIKEAANFYFGVPAGTTRKIDINDTYEPIPVHTRETDRYIVLMTPEGKIIRMSKKFGNLVCCISGEEQDKECTEQISKWREKIVTSSAGHSPANFMDILSLLSTLQEDDQF